MKINLPEHVNQIIHRLQKEGYDAYFGAPGDREVSVLSYD